MVLEVVINCSGHQAHPPTLHYGPVWVLFVVFYGDNQEMFIVSLLFQSYLSADILPIIDLYVAPLETSPEMGINY